MFHWICPECGREIAPAVKECPTCDRANAAAEPVLAGDTAYTLVAEPPPAALIPEVVFAPRVQRSRYAAGETRHPAREARHAASEAMVLTIDAEPVAEPLGPPPPPTRRDPALARKAPLPHIEAAPPRSPHLTAGRPIPAESEPVLTASLLAEPVERVLPAVIDRVADHRELSPVDAPWASSIAADPEAPAAPPTIRPRLEPMGGRPRLADLCVDTKAAMERLRPVYPHRHVRSDVREQVTIPGPALPIELTSLEGAGISKILRPRAAKAAAAKSGVSGWILSALVAATVVATSVWAALYLMPVDAAPVPTPKAEPKVEAKPVSPLAKFVEVTGFRHVVLGDRSEIRYLVVNHSTALLSDVTVFVTLRGPSPEPGAPLVSNFSFKMPKLGPWESKEMVSPVEKVTRPGAMPEWRDLTAEIEISQ